MDKREAQVRFGEYRKQVYASLNGTKGNLIKLSNSNLLSIKEKELLKDVISALDKLRVEYITFKNKNIITAKQQPENPPEIPY